MTDSLHQVTVQVHVPSGPTTPGPDGTPTRATKPFDWFPCNFQPRSSSEDRDGKHQITIEYFISGPLDQRIVEGSTVTVAGETYKVRGKPRHFNSGVLDHTEMILLDEKG